MGFQHLFHKRSTVRAKEKADINETVRTLIDARFDRLEAKMKAIELEWSDVYDKIMLLYDRTRKRIQSAKKASDEEKPIQRELTPPRTREDLLRAYDAQNGA